MGVNMKDAYSDQKKFFSEISEYQISANEFFSTILLDYLNKNFGWEKIMILYFDKHGEFLSWTNWKGAQFVNEDHPYRGFVANDVIRHVIYQKAVRDHLTYFNVTPRLYKSTDIISEIDYEYSAYVRFIEENFQMHYSVTMAFGINAYIQVVFLKDSSQGDFTEEEIHELNEIYIYIANAYKNFKKYEQAKIVQNIQKKIIVSGEKAYVIVDDFMHIMNYSETALNYLKDIFDSIITDQISSTNTYSWLSLILNEENDHNRKNYVQVKVIKNYVFKVYTYDQTYSNGIVDRYYWITITKIDEAKISNYINSNISLTPTEQKVAEHLYNGLTYKAIADEMIVSYHTIKKHVQNIYSKCGVNSRYELCKWLDDRN